MEEKAVAVRIREGRAVTHPRVERVHRECDSRVFEGAACPVDVWHAKRDRPAEQRERDGYVRRLVLHPPLARARVAGKPERPAVKGLGSSEVADGESDEVCVLDADHGRLPSGYGA
jgi:hypothetical protein